ncbi:MAG: lipopolysaccharide biosynthesis protein RfbH [Candidatus Gastranaerophilales bacterium]|nr:lipopolysaccharide biosynthesis protein RfbH [Candidatus Gastranaerophilales bacterium]
MFHSLMENILRAAIKKLGKVYYNTVYKKRNKSNYIPASGKVLGAEELCNMFDASMDMWLTTGRFNKAFEEKFAKYLGVKHCLTVNSGSSANLLALSSLMSYKLTDRQVKKGDEVISVAAGFPTTINPILQNGLIPVFIDCDINTCNIKIDDIEKAITPKTKVIMLAHTMGNVYNLEKIKQLCDKYKLWLIEDNCDALGATYKGKYTGTYGDIATFSFYPAHFITMGEGGAVITNDTQLNKIIKSYRDWGRDCWCEPGHDNTCNCRFEQQWGKLPFGYDHKYTYSHVGYNMKITDWQAAIGLAQLDKVDSFIQKRRDNFKYLYNKLSDLNEYLILPQIDTEANPSWFGFLISIKPNEKFNKFQMVEYLEENGVGTRQLFAGNILRQPMFVENDIPLRINDSQLLNSKNLTEEHYKMLPNTDFIMNNTFWVGVFPALGEKELNHTSDIIHKFIEDHCE